MFGLDRKPISHKKPSLTGPQASVWFGRAPGVISTIHGDETVLLNVKRGQYHTLNPVASRLWELLATATTPVVLIDVIRQEYEFPVSVPTDQVERDVASILAQFESLGLVVATSGAR